ncbi:hypothetical protein EJ071_14830 [Mesorhizobium sp. M1B.F.Ca.ET.045.04.1.1]|nr:hypothetical protein EJ071_14830 [Mesorhizobium sp. M1B.F.Ca.ET.045.04.1.1]
MPLMSVLRTLVVGLTVMSCAVIATSASARDRPGTPTDPQIYGGLGLGVTVIWKNTAGTVFTIGGIRPELVGFEVEMTKNGNKYAPPISGLPREVGANWNPSFFEYHTTPNQLPTSPINIVGFTIKEVDPNTKYCFRVRARRKSDDVVSANWSGTSCVTTGSPPTKPIKHTCRAGDRGRARLVKPHGRQFAFVMRWQPLRPLRKTAVVAVVAPAHNGLRAGRITSSGA